MSVRSELIPTSSAIVPGTPALISGLLFAIVCLTWGTTWIAIKFAVDTIPPLTAAGLRFAIAFPVFVLIAKAMQQPIAFPAGRRGFFCFVLICYFSLPYFLLNYGEQYVLPGLTALVFSAMPVFSLIFARIVLDERLTGIQYAGIALGFSGFLFILLDQGLLLGGSSLAGIAAIAAAAALHGLCYVITKQRGANIGIVTFNTLPIGAAGAGMLLAGVLLEQPDWSAVSRQSWLGVLYLALVASVGGFCSYFLLIKRMSVVVASYVFLIFPLISIGIDVMSQQQTLSLSFLLACLVVIVGFLLTKQSSWVTVRLSDLWRGRLARYVR